jgi:hypothetical protein
MDLSESHALLHVPRLRIDLAPVADAVYRGLAGEVPRSRIDAVLENLLAHEFSDARVTAYVPIFLQRLARERLLAEMNAPLPH